MKKLFILIFALTLCNVVKAQAPDLKTGVSFSYNWAQQTNDLSLTWDFFNVGGNTSTTFTIAYIASTDLTIDAGDYMLDYVVASGAVANAFATVNFTAQLAPDALPTAVYNLIVFIDYGDNVTESNENNNIVKFGTFNFINQGVGIKENISNLIDVSVYPNPAVENLEIALNLKEKIKDISYSLVDLSGHEVMNNACETDDLSIKKEVILPPLAKGIYFLNIKSGSAIIATKKIIIN